MKPADARPTSSEPTPPLPATVGEIGKIHFEGNIIPHQWYQHVTLESGKPDLPAIIILAEIIYWYRPYQTLTKGGKPLLRKHFDGDMFQCTAAYFEAKFGLTKDQIRKALKRLEDAGYIRREYRDVIQQGILRNNIMFIEPVPLAILAITHPSVGPEVTPPLSPVGDTLSPVGDTLLPVGDTLSPVGDIFNEYKITTETTSEISTTTTTPNPFSTTEPVPDPEPEGGGGGFDLIFDFELANLTPEQRKRAAKTLEGLTPEIAQQVLDEWNHAHACDGIRQSRWGWLRKVADAARAGQFVPSAELADRRQALAQTSAPTSRELPPERHPSALWRAQREELREDVPEADFNVYIATLRGREDTQTLWLEAPNRLVAEWVNGHLPLIEGALRPHTELPVRVCIG
jgi:hypothetical protein